MLYIYSYLFDTLFVVNKIIWYVRCSVAFQHGAANSLTYQLIHLIDIKENNNMNIKYDDKMKVK